MKSQIYEFTGEGLKPMTEEGKTEFKRGQVLHWGGNMGSPAREYVIVERLKGYEGRINYKCIGLKSCLDKNYKPYYHNIDAYSIKLPTDETSHNQHHFLIEKIIPEGEINILETETEENIKKDAILQEKLRQEREHKINIGKELFKKYIPDTAKALIIAEHNINNSDSMTDYYNHLTDKRVILGYSTHTRDLFSEMRKYAAKFKETAHLGTGRGIFKPVVLIDTDFNSNGSSYWKGNISHWHNDLVKDGFYLQTKENAELFIENMGQPESINFEDQEVKFKWDINSVELEHREKYSMGAGYYLKYGFRDSTGWKVSKSGKCRDYTTKKEYWGDEDYISIAEFNIFETEAYLKPQDSKINDNMINHKGEIRFIKNEAKNGLEIHFKGKPDETTRNILKSHGFRWSRFNKCWYKLNKEGLEEEIKTALGVV